MDGLACIDDQESVKLCQVLTDPVGGEVITKRYGVTSEGRRPDGRKSLASAARAT